MSTPNSTGKQVLGIGPLLLSLVTTAIFYRRWALSPRVGAGTTVATALATGLAVVAAAVG